MRNVLHLINTAGPGGAETVYLELVCGLDPRHWESHVVLPETDWLTHQLVARGFHPILEAARHRLDFGYVSRLVKLVRSNSIDIIHSHLFGPSVEASLIGLITGVPVVCTIHGKGDLRPDERLRRLKFAILNRGASRVVFVSESLRNYFLGEGRMQRDATAVIANGVDVSVHGDAVHGPAGGPVPDDLDLPPGRFVVGALGNLRPVKRYDVLLRAAALLVERSPDYFFVIVGQTDPDLHAELLALRDSLGLQSFVRFTGFREDVPRILSRLDLFALTSDSEGFSIATVQAMVHGLPIVATRCGGPEEILEHGRSGFLVAPGSPEELRAAVEMLRADPDKRALFGREARRDAHARYSLASQIRAYENLYEGVLDRSHSDKRIPQPEPA